VAVSVELGSAHVHVIRDILARGICKHVGISPVIPVVPLVPLIVLGENGCSGIARNDVQELARLNLPGKLVVRRFQETLPDYRIGITVFDDVKPIRTLAQGVESRRRSVDFEIDPAPDNQAGQSDEYTYLYQVLIKREDFDVRLFGEAINRAFVELDFRPPIAAGIDPVPGLQRHIDAGGSPIYLTGMLKADVSIKV
jgi:hypothetical protein